MTGNTITANVTNSYAGGIVGKYESFGDGNNYYELYINTFTNGGAITASIAGGGLFGELKAGIGAVGIKTPINNGAIALGKSGVVSPLNTAAYAYAGGIIGNLVSSKKNEGGFVSIINGELAPENERNTFTVDMLITAVNRIEKNEEKNINEDFVTVRGAIFNFRNELLPLDFLVRNSDGMKYFEDLGVTGAEPLYTKVWGRINCGTILNEVKEDSAFGESAVRTYERKIREWVITGTAKVPYEFGDENVLTAAEVNKAQQDREVMLAETKKRSEEYRASKTTADNAFGTTVTAPTPSTKAGTFSF
jgi:hypothetical protein